MDDNTTRPYAMVFQSQGLDLFFCDGSDFDAMAQTAQNIRVALAGAQITYNETRLTSHDNGFRKVFVMGLELEHHVFRSDEMDRLQDIAKVRFRAIGSATATQIFYDGSYANTEVAITVQQGKPMLGESKSYDRDAFRHYLKGDTVCFMLPEPIGRPGSEGDDPLISAFYGARHLGVYIRDAITMRQCNILPELTVPMTATE
ncbi:MAG: hypothetical protein ACQR33_00105 [Candidatus Saccharibacteria bacterium]